MRTEQYQNETEYQDDCRTHLLRCAGCRSEHRTNSGAARCESLGAYDIRVTPPFVKSIVLSLKQSDGELTLTVKDNGHGFGQGSGVMEGMGLRIMQYRADMIGAMLRVDSTIGKGTTVACRLKVAQ